MQISWGSRHVISLPIEEWRFDPDPLGLNDMACQCDGCRLRRRLKELQAAGAAFKVVGCFPLLEEVTGKMPVPPGVSPEMPAITEYDVDGGQPRAGALPLVPPRPAWHQRAGVYAIRFVAWCAGWAGELALCCCALLRDVLGAPRTTFRVIHKD